MKVLLFMAALLWGTAGQGQYWRPIGRGVIGPNEVQSLYGDSVSDRLLAGGTFVWILNETDTVLGLGLAAWGGTRWDSIATRMHYPVPGNTSTTPTYWFLRYQGELYACGSFTLQQSNGEWTNNLARLDEQTQHWEGLGCNIPSMSGILTLVPKAPDSTLYATGYMGYTDEFCGFPASCVFNYDGTAFHPWPPFDLIPEGNDRYVGTVFDYRGKTYMTCSVPDPTGQEGFVSFIRWNGTTWEHVPGWNTLSPIKEILIHDDTLYVAGTFRLDTGGPGDLIASFDGEHWNNMGGGLGYNAIPMSGAALDLEWWHGKLLVSGFFNRAGGEHCSSIAQWNGHQWCTFPGEIQWHQGSLPMLTDMAIWRDSLYICGGIYTIDGEPVRNVAQWIGGDAVDNCSTPTAIAELTSGTNELMLVPLPGLGQWQVHFPHGGRWSLAVYDATGRLVKQMRTGNRMAELDLATTAPGIYMVRATNDQGMVLGTKVLRP